MSGRAYATHAPWHYPDKRRYGSEDSYRIAAEWLAPCAQVADWGGGGGHFRRFLGRPLTVVDGTAQAGVDVVADLAAYREPADGILLRHVVDNTHEPDAVLANALASYRRRLAVVTYTADADVPHVALMQGDWPVWNLDPERLRRAMGAALRLELLTGRGPERVYLLERPQ